MHDQLFDKPYASINDKMECFAIISMGALGFRFGPMTPVEAGKIMTRAVNERLGNVLITMNCGPEFDWELAADVCPRVAEPVNEDNSADATENRMKADD